MNRFEIETLIEEYEWLVSFKASDNDLVYVVSINSEDVNWEEHSVNYIHIENTEYIYYVGEGDYKLVEKCYDEFKIIEKEVVKELKSFL